MFINNNSIIKIINFITGLYVINILVFDKNIKVLILILLALYFKCMDIFTSFGKNIPGTSIFHVLTAIAMYQIKANVSSSNVTV